MEDDIDDGFEETLLSMKNIAEYDGELVLNTVLDNYRAFIHEDPKSKKKIHKFLIFNEEIRELTKKQLKIIEYCKEHETITDREVVRLIDINVEKNDILDKALKLFGVKRKRVK